MKLQKFDLEKALNGAKVVTRDGHEVTQLTKFESVNDDYPVIGVLDNNLQAWTTQGKFNTNHGESDADLFLAVEPQRVWVNVFKGNIGNLYVGFTTYDSKEMAIRCKDNLNPESYIKTIEITDEL
jgi:hypothetical protein